ncbi:jasmonate-induced oxygenase 4-like [Macadamia integrifolia]|uniref:jasmonate-induced oxygenase 4-like n=1 Tax=Macadamia integrifolia TaxID=60698 RepID=UPI001C4E6163|nr:jasmonate-induced oxygenase 4-like [Macadamia integrifolia]
MATATSPITGAGLKPAGMKWPEQIKYVQELAESGVKLLPPQYIKFEQGQALHEPTVVAPPQKLPPVIDMFDINGASGTAEKKAMLEMLGSACRQWGIFQVVNHGIPPALLDEVKRVSREFFDLPMEEKLKYANNPVTYEGYGNRTGVQEGSTLDWNDYFYHFIRPFSAINGQKSWPHQPEEYRTVISEYGEKVVELCEALLSIFSEDLGLEKKDTLLESLGGDEELGAGYRVNFYPKCPQPELALGLSPHTDPGAMTVLLQDQVSGLQLKKDGVWIPIPSRQDALTVLLADQLEILSNGIYKSVNHRSTVNSKKERMSIAIFIHPEGNKMIGPLEEVVKKSGRSPLYNEMTFNEYRIFIRTLGLKGQAILSSRVINT